MTITYSAEFKWTSLCSNKKTQNLNKGKIDTRDVGLYIDELLSYTDHSDPINPQTFYVTTDRQFSVRTVVDSDGNIVEERNYSPMGIDLEGNAETSDLAYGFTGRRYDQESDLYYFRARYYSTELGSFISRDPLEYVDGMNMYSGYFARQFAVDPFGYALTVTHDGDIVAYYNTDESLRAALGGKSSAGSTKMFITSYELEAVPNVKDNKSCFVLQLKSVNYIGVVKMTSKKLYEERYGKFDTDAYKYYRSQMKSKEYNNADFYAQARQKSISSFDAVLVHEKVHLSQLKRDAKKIFELVNKKMKEENDPVLTLTYKTKAEAEKAIADDLSKPTTVKLKDTQKQSHKKAFSALWSFYFSQARKEVERGYINTNGNNVNTGFALDDAYEIEAVEAELKYLDKLVK